VNDGACRHKPQSLATDPGPGAFRLSHAQEQIMDEQERGPTNARPLHETIAGTGPGIADDAFGVGEEMLKAPSDAEVAAVARKLGAPIAAAQDGREPPAQRDVAPEGTPGTGEDVCRTCNGSGRVEGGTCPTCDGTGIVITGIGGG
jgi:hypothetical protein